MWWKWSIPSFFAKQADIVLLACNSIIPVPESEKLSSLVLPVPDARVLHLCEIKPVNLDYDTGNRQNLSYEGYGIQVCLKQMICGRRQPAFRSRSVIEPGFRISDVLTAYRLLASR